jgi:hypothetical protein
MKGGFAHRPKPSFVDLELVHVRGRQRDVPRNSRRAIVGLPLTRNGDRVLGSISNRERQHVPGTSTRRYR